MTNDKIKYVDLFCGTGAFSYIFNKSNKCECVYSNDIDKNSEIIYKLNFPLHNFILKDINLIDPKDIPEHDLLCGGFPCQPFSIAGDKKGFDDIRANVFWRILEILKEHKTKIVLLENVKNLISHDKGLTFKKIIEELEKLNYYIKYKILDTSIISEIPQHRERIYIICFKDKNKYDNFNFNFNNKENKKIKEYLEDIINDKYYYTNRYKSYDLINKEITKLIDDNVLYQYRRFYIRENKNNKCPTLTANMGEGGHNVPLLKDNKGIRKLTPKECFNLQGFPKDYKIPLNLSDSSLYKLSGNAVSIPVIELIINNILNL